MNNHIQAFVQTQVFLLGKQMPRSVIAALYDKHVFEFLRNYSVIFHRSSTVLHSTSSVWETYVLSILTTIWYLHFFIQLFSDDVVSYVISICISLMANNIGHLFMCHSYIFFDQMSVHVCCSFSVELFLTFELWEFFIYSRYKSFVGNVVCK